MNLFTDFVSLDIGSHSLKLLSLSPAPGAHGYVIDDYVYEVLPPGLIGGGFTNPIILSMGDFAKIIKIQVSKISSMKEGLIVGLPDRWVKIQLLDLTLKPNEFGSSEYLSWRLKKMFAPPGVGDLLVDYQILSLSETPEGIKCWIMVGLVQRNIVEVISSLFAGMKIELMAFDTSSLGVYNLLEDAYPDRSLDRQLVICHIGHETTVVKMFDHGLLRYERIIEVAGETFGANFSHFLDIPFEQAQIQKCHQNFFPVEREEILNHIQDRNLFERVFGNWLRELHVTFKFYQDKFKVSRLPRLYLTGGSSLFEGLPEFLSDYFDTPCERFNPIADIPSPREHNANIVAIGPLLAPCVGLLAK
ncbi:pilus assembly protein PilM [bacterium]|nr:pilus assembly protein PilM [bacterium]